MKAKWQNTVIDINRSLILARGYLKCNGVALVIFSYYSARLFYKNVYRFQKTLTVSFKHLLINIAGDL